MNVIVGTLHACMHACLSSVYVCALSINGHIASRCVRCNVDGRMFRAELSESLGSERCLVSCVVSLGLWSLVIMLVISVYLETDDIDIYLTGPTGEIGCVRTRLTFHNLVRYVYGVVTD